MSIKFAKQIVEEMDSRGPISVPDGCVTGEEHEEWMRQDSKDRKKISESNKFYGESYDYTR